MHKSQRVPGYQIDADSILLQIEETPDYFRTVIKAGGIMDVVEQYPWTGQEQRHSRRDKRSGHHFGKVVKTEEGPAIL